MKPETIIHMLMALTAYGETTMITDGTHICKLCGEARTGCALCGSAPLISITERLAKKRAEERAAEFELAQQERCIRGC